MLLNKCSHFCFNSASGVKGVWRPRAMAALSSECSDARFPIPLTCLGCGNEAIQGIDGNDTAVLFDSRCFQQGFAAFVNADRFQMTEGVANEIDGGCFLTQ